MKHKLFEKHVFLLFLALLPIGLSVNAEPIEFADDEVKAICVAHWDDDGDGELSYEEAAGVTDLLRAFTNNSSITSFDELQYFTGITEIYVDFKGCTNLASIIIPKNVTLIYHEAFSDCSSLTSVIIPKSVTSIGDYAFNGCSSLTYVIIPKSVTSIGYGAFNDCSGLTYVTVGWETPINTFDNAFSGNRGDCELRVPSGSYDDYAGYEGEFPGGVHEVSNINFIDANTKAVCVEYWDTNGDGQLSYDEAAAVTRLGREFYGNTAVWSFDELQYFTGLTEIGYNAFEGCSKLTDITIPENVITIGSDAFRETNLNFIDIPKSVTYIGPYAFSFCSNLISIKVDIENTVYDSRNDCNAIINTKTNTLEQSCTNTTIPNSVTVIGNGAFGGCNITSINIPSSVTTIKDWAFSASNLTSIDIPNSVTTIRPWAFAYCDKLSSVKIPNSVTSIGSNAFNTCSSLTSVVSEITEPFEVYHICDYCDNIVLTVPYGTRDAYIAAGWTEEMFKGGIVEAALGPNKIVMETSSGEARKAMGYSSQYGLDFTNVTDVKAYIASGYTDEGVVLLSRVNIVPPNTGVYLTTENAGVEVEVPITDKNTCYANLLYPIVTEQTVEPNVTVGGVDYMTFAVGVLAGSGEMGFVNLNASRTMGPNKCILRVPARYYPTEARSMGGFKMMFTDEEATGVEHISTYSRTADDCYDLQGRKVKANEMKQGLYIINGKKVWVK